MDLVFDIIEMILKLVWLIGTVPAAVFFVRRVAARPETEHYCSRSMSTDTELCRKDHSPSCLQTRTTDDPTPRLKHLVPAIPLAFLWPIAFASVGILHVAGGSTKPKEVESVPTPAFGAERVRAINAAYEEALKLGPHAPDNVKLAEELHDTREELHKARQGRVEADNRALELAQQLKDQERSHAQAMTDRWSVPDNVIRIHADRLSYGADRLYEEERARRLKRGY